MTRRQGTNVIDFKEAKEVRRLGTQLFESMRDFGLFNGLNWEEILAEIDEIVKIVEKGVRDRTNKSS